MIADHRLDEWDGWMDGWMHVSAAFFYHAAISPYIRMGFADFGKKFANKRRAFSCCKKVRNSPSEPLIESRLWS
jgi:hypothetical protein